MRRGCHVDAIRVTHGFNRPFLFICSLKSVCPSPYLFVQVMNPFTNFVRPNVLSLLVTSSLKFDSVNSICLPWNLPLWVVPYSMGLSLDTPDRHMEWRPQLVLGNCALIDKVVASHKCCGTRGEILVVGYSDQIVASSSTSFPLSLSLSLYIYIYVAFPLHFYYLQPFPSVRAPLSSIRI